jgi:hypothetical protein
MHHSLEEVERGCEPYAYYHHVHEKVEERGCYDHLKLEKKEQHSIGAAAFSKQQQPSSSTNHFVLPPSMTHQVFVFSSIPLLFIIFISFFHILVVHAPYLNGNCKGVHCVAGSAEQFVWWTLLALVLMYFIARLLFSCSWQAQKLSDFDGKWHIIQSGVLYHLDEASDFRVS